MQPRESKSLDKIMSLPECISHDRGDVQALRDLRKRSHHSRAPFDSWIRRAPLYCSPATSRWRRDWLQRGFCVIHGNPTSEDVLKLAGADRAQAIMISMQDKAAAVLTVLSARSISKSLLISVTATTDDMIEKLKAIRRRPRRQSLSRRGAICAAVDYASRNRQFLAARPLQ